MGRLPLLDALRTVAALGVAGFHLAERFGTDGPVSRGGVMARGYLFVDLFFILSGFVLALGFEGRMLRGLGAGAFLMLRWRRLWPMVALGAVAGAAAFLPWTPWTQVLGLLVMALAMVPVINPTMALYPLNGPQWSLLWEVLANGLHGALLWRLGARGLLVVLALSGAGLLWGIWLVGSCRFGPNAQLWWLAGPRVVWSYTLGIAMARVWRRGLAPVVDWRVALALPLVAVMALGLRGGAEAPGDALMVLIGWPVLFWLVACGQVAAGAGKALTRIGTLSFPLYALHLPVIVAVSFFSRSTGAGMLAAGLVLGAAMGAAGVMERRGRIKSRLCAGAAAL